MVSLGMLKEKKNKKKTMGEKEESENGTNVLFLASITDFESG